MITSIKVMINRVCFILFISVIASNCGHINVNKFINFNTIPSKNILKQRSFISNRKIHFKPLKKLCYYFFLYYLKSAEAVRFDTLYLDQQSSGFSQLKTFGGINRDTAEDVIVAEDNTVVTTGITSSFSSGTAKNNDLYFARYKSDDSGIFCASKIGGIGDEGGSSIAELDKNFYVVGHTSTYGAGGYDILLAKFNYTCYLDFAISLGGSGDEYGYAITKTDQKYLAITGRTNSFGGGNSDIFTTLFNKNLVVVWSKAVGENGNEYGYDIFQSSDKNIIVTGWTNSYGAGSEDIILVKHDIDNGFPIWTRTYGGTLRDRGNSVVEASDEILITTGYTESFGSGLKDIIVIRTALTSGNYLSAQVIGGVRDDTGSKIILTSDGGWVIVGSTNSANLGTRSFDALAIKYNASNAIVSSVIFGGRDREYASGVSQRSDNSFTICGRTRTYGFGDYDAILAFLPEDLLAFCSSPYIADVEDIRSVLSVSNINVQHFTLNIFSQSINRNNIVFDQITFSQSTACEESKSQNVFYLIYYIISSLVFLFFQ